MSQAFIHTYRGIGDTIYSMPSIEKLCAQYDEVYGATAFPLLYNSIPNFRPLNPYDKDWGGEWSTNELHAGYWEHCHDTRGEFVPPGEWSDEYQCQMNRKFDNDPLFRVSLALEQFQPGRNMIRHCLEGWCPENPVLRLPAYPGKFDRVAEDFLDINNRSGMPLLFHSVDQNRGDEVSDRSCPNEVFRHVQTLLKGHFDLFDARKYDSDRPILFPQAVVPIYNSMGWGGICGIMALMNASYGVVLQNSCSLLPIAQALGKPVLCLNGPCGLRLEHCTDERLPASQRCHVWVEADERCECKTTPGLECRKPRATYSDLESKVEEFIEML